MKTITLITILIFLSFCGQSQNFNKFNKKLRFDKNNLKTEQNYQKSTNIVNDFGSAPDVGFAKQFGGSGIDIFESSKVDENGNIYLTGSFSGQIALNGNTYESTGLRDGIICKLNATGELQWLTQVPTEENHKSALFDITINTNGDVYVAGYYTGQIEVGTATLPNRDENAICIIQVSADGVLKNAGHIENNRYGLGISIDHDNNGNLYAIESSNEDLTKQYTSYVHKFNQDLELQWSQSHDESFKEVLIFNDKVFFTGLTYADNDGTLENDVSYSTPFEKDIFIARADLAGNYDWVKVADHQIGARSENPIFAVDIEGDIYLVGDYSDDIEWDGINVNLYNNGTFISLFDQDGNFQWVEDSNIFRVKSISIDKSSTYSKAFIVGKEHIREYDDLGNLYSWYTSVDFKPSTISVVGNNELVVAGSKDGLLKTQKINSDYSIAWNSYFEGNTGLLEIDGIVTDNEDNIYIIGEVTGKPEINEYVLNDGAYVAKLNPNGEVIWVENILGKGVDIIDDCGYSLNIDEQNQFLYATGNNYYDTLQIGDSIINTNAANTFLIQFSTNGNMNWHKVYEGVANFPDIKITPTGEVIFSTSFNGYWIMDEYSFNNESSFISKFDSNGNILWAFPIIGDEYEWNFLNDVDEEGNIYFTGEFHSKTMQINNTEVNLSDSSGTLFLGKLNTDGELQWHKTFGNIESGVNDYMSFPTGIKFSENGSIYLKGEFESGVYFDEELLENPYGNPYGLFISKISQEGNVEWIEPIVSNGYAWDFTEFDLDSDGNVYMGAKITDTVHFGNDFDLYPSSSNDIFIAKYLNNGQLSWVKTMQGKAEWNWLSGVTLTQDNNLYVAGYMDDYLAIDNSTFYTDIRNGFLINLNQTVGFSDVYNSSEDYIHIYPNPTQDQIKINAPQENMAFKIQNITGQTVYQFVLDDLNGTVDLSHLPQGLYFVSYQYGSNKYSKKLILE